MGEVAFGKFTTSVPGMINRSEGEEGLKKLNFTSTNPDMNMQDAFTVLDKKGHHVLTLADLQDRHKGGIHDGVILDPVMGLCSSLFQEAMHDCLMDVVSEVMADMLQDELNNPRVEPKGADVKKWLQRREAD